MVAGRLAWARRLIIQGAPAHITAGAAAVDGRAKVKIIIDHRGVATSPIARTLLVDTVDSIAWRARQTITVDRGHRHVSTGCSEICIWMSAHPVARAADVFDGPPAPGGPDDGFGGPGSGHGGRPRRGRSPPSAPDADHDPWHGTGNVDPWAASSSQTSPPHKAPRKRHLGAESDSLWCNWLPTTADSSSVTPDPPWTRLPRPRARLRSTGTPPLVVSGSQDGPFVATGVISFSEHAVISAAAIESEYDLEDTMPTQSVPKHDVHISGHASCFTNPARGQWADVDDSVSEDSVADDAFDIWSMLESPVGPASCVMGAALDTVPECDEEIADDDSLVNQSHAVRALVNAQIADVRKFWRLAEFEPPHIIEDGQVAYLHDSACPHIVVRSGYGHYLSDVRIRRWDEPDNYTSGRWLPHTAIITLEINDTVIPGRDVRVCTTDGHIIAAGTHCLFKGFDKDDDIQLLPVGTLAIRTIFNEEFLHFNVR